MNMKNRILAIPLAAPAIPPNPRTPAIIAITKKIKAHFNIFLNLLGIICIPKFSKLKQFHFLDYPNTSTLSPAFTIPPFNTIVKIPSFGITHFPTFNAIAHPE